MNLETTAHRKVDAIQAALEKLPAHEFKMIHRFRDGTYIRTMVIPKGCLLVGKIHRTNHPFVVSKGRIAIWDEQGGTRTVTAPFKGISESGARRIGYAFEDTVWSTYHRTDKTTPEEVEAEIIEPREFDRNAVMQIDLKEMLSGVERQLT
jgi:hypothetical protein